jgi:hypothetical protein
VTELDRECSNRTLRGKVAGSGVEVVEAIWGSQVDGGILSATETVCAPFVGRKDGGGSRSKAESLSLSRLSIETHCAARCRCEQGRDLWTGA